MNPQHSTLVEALLKDLSVASTGWYTSILPYAKSIFFTLVGFQLVWTTITFALGRRQGDEFISMLVILLAHEISLICTISASSISLGRKAKPTTTYTHRISLAADQAASTLTTTHVLARHLTFG